MKGEVGFEGFDELGKKLQQMAEQLDEETLIKAMMPAAQFLLKKMKGTDAFEDSSGGMRKSMVIHRPRGQSDKYAVLRIGPTDPRAHLVEFGTGRRRSTPKNTKALKFGDDKFATHTESSAPAHPFVRRAYHENRREMMEILRDSLRKYIMPKR